MTDHAAGKTNICSNNRSNASLSSSPVKNTNRAPRTTVLVRNIPSHCNNITSLHEYFKKFGNVTNVNVNKMKNSAIIKFETM